MAARRTHKLIPAGSRAPGFRLERLDGGEAGLGELIANGPVLLVFFKISCPVCQFSLPYYQRVDTAGRLTVYGISQNGPEATREFAEEFGITFPMLLDSEDEGYPASNAYGISSVPTNFVVQPDGVITRVIEGWNKKELQWLGEQVGIAAIREGDNVPEWKAG